MKAKIQYLTLDQFEALSLQTSTINFHKNPDAKLIDEEWIHAQRQHLNICASAKDIIKIDESCGRLFLFAANRIVETLTGDLALAEEQIKGLRATATRLYQRAQDVDGAPLMRDAKRTISDATSYGIAMRSLPVGIPAATNYEKLCDIIPSYESIEDLLKKQNHTTQPSYVN